MRLKTCLSWDFQRSSCHALQEFLRRGKKNGQTNLVPISGRVPVLDLEFAHGRSGVQPVVENLPKDRHGNGGFCGGFLQLIFLVAKYKRKKKNPPKKSASRKQKIRRRPPPPEIRQPGPKIRRKTYQQIRLSNLQQVHAGFFRLRRIALGGASSEHGFWDTLWLPSGHGRGSHVEMHLQSLSCCWWDGQGLLRTLPDNTYSQKRSF